MQLKNTLPAVALATGLLLVSCGKTPAPEAPMALPEPRPIEDTATPAGPDAATPAPATPTNDGMAAPAPATATSDGMAAPAPAPVPTNGTQAAEVPRTPSMNLPAGEAPAAPTDAAGVPGTAAPTSTGNTATN